jgi:hypothetical protein
MAGARSFSGQLVGEYRSYRRLVRVLHQPGISPGRVGWPPGDLAPETPPAVLTDALGVSLGIAMRHAFLSGADWCAYAAR